MPFLRCQERGFPICGGETEWPYNPFVDESLQTAASASMAAAGLPQIDRPGLDLFGDCACIDLTAVKIGGIISIC